MAPGFYHISIIYHGIIRIFNEARISSSTCDIVINHDIIRKLNEVRISSSPVIE